MKSVYLYVLLLQLVLLISPCSSNAQTSADSNLLQFSDSLITDSLAADSLKDTVVLVPENWSPYNLTILQASQKAAFKRSGDILPGKVNPAPTQAWIIAWVIGVLLIVIIYKRMYPYQFSLQLSAVFNPNKFKELAETQTDIYKLGRFLTLLVSVNILALAMYLLVYAYNVKTLYTQFTVFIIILVTTLVLHVLQRILRTVYAGTFNQREFMSHYTLIQRSNGFFLAIYSLPLLLICYYQNSDFFRQIFPYTFVIILILYTIYSLVKSISVNYGGQKGSTLYLFLYLCSFEILPLFVMFKFVNNLLFNG